MEYDYLAKQQFKFSEDHCIVDQIGLKRKRGVTEQLKSDVFVPPMQRNQANARERDRTHSYGEEIATLEYNEVSKRNKGVNTAFTMLRTLIPTEPKNRKLSKIETLRLASSYISHLRTQLLSGSIEQPCLQFIKTTNVKNSDYNRSQVCTFCMAMKKNTRMFSRESTIPSLNMEPQFYFDTKANFIVLSDENMPNFTPSFVKSSPKTQ